MHTAVQGYNNTMFITKEVSRMKKTYNGVGALAKGVRR
jgi:hypothetical protein